MRGNAGRAWTPRVFPAAAPLVLAVLAPATGSAPGARAPGTEARVRAEAAPGTPRCPGAGLIGVRDGSTAFGDVDGDGDLDLVLAGERIWGGQTTTLYLNDGRGAFAPVDAGLRNVTSSSTAFGDVNGDGAPDLVLAGGDLASTEQTAVVYLGDGDGGFTPSGAGLTGMERGSLDLGDVDGDGNLDLVLAGSAGGTPATILYLGDGRGHFTRGDAGLEGVSDGSSALGDLNGDGHLDLVLTGSDAAGDPAAIVYVGDGQGGFTEADAGLAGVEYSSSVLGDFDGDDDLDLLLTGQQAGRELVTTLYLNDGDAGFVAAEAELAGARSAASEAGDVNGDGNLDVVIAGDGPSGWPTTRLYLGDGRGGFTTARGGVTGYAGAPPSLGDRDHDGELEANAGLDPTGGGPSASLGDVDGDGHLDLLLTGRKFAREEDHDLPTLTREHARYRSANPYLGHTTSLYMGSDEGGFHATHITGVQSGSSEFADIDGDGNPDLLIAGNDPGGRPFARLYLGDDRGCFTAANAELAGVTGSPSSAVGDVNRDGNLDLVVTGRIQDPERRYSSLLARTLLYLGDGEGGFRSTDAGLADVVSGSSDFGDVNGDGNPDLVLTGYIDPTWERDLASRLYLGDGEGGFDDAEAGLVPLVGESDFGDVDHDGDLDLLLSGRTNVPAARMEARTILYENDGQGRLTPFDIELPDLRPGGVALARVDRDEHLDVLLAGLKENLFPALEIYLGSGQGDFTEANTGLTDELRDCATSLGDVDNDGHPDLFVSGSTLNDELDATLYLGDGRGGFTATDTDVRPLTRCSSDFADVDNDGDLDLFIAGWNGSISVSRLYLGDGNGGFSRAHLGLPTPEPPSRR